MSKCHTMFFLSKRVVYLTLGQEGITLGFVKTFINLPTKDRLKKKYEKTNQLYFGGHHVRKIFNKIIILNTLEEYPNWNINIYR